MTGLTSTGEDLAEELSLGGAPPTNKRSGSVVIEALSHDDVCMLQVRTPNLQLGGVFGPRRLESSQE